MVDKKYLIAGGDSFTQGHMLGDTGSWAYWVANDANLQLVNLGCDGAGNEYISTSILSWLIKNPDKLNQVIVLVGWSDLSRKLIYHSIDSHVFRTHIVPNDLMVESDAINTTSEFIFNNRDVLRPLFGTIAQYVYETYKNMLIIKVFLESNNIPFLFFDAVSSNKCYVDGSVVYIPNLRFPDGTSSSHIQENLYSDELFENIISNDVINFIFDKKYIDFDGFTIFEWLHKDLQNYSYGNDGHTNETGAREISKMIISKYNEVYCG